MTPTDLLVGAGLASAGYLLGVASAVYLARRILSPREHTEGMEWKNE